MESNPSAWTINKVIQGILATQDRFLVLNIVVKSQIANRDLKSNKKSRWGNLKGEAKQTFKDIELKQGNCNWNLNKLWDQIAGCIIQVAKEVLGQ